MPQINLSILNQKATPAFFADTLANRPAAGFVGRIFVSTDTLDLYRDTGSAWVLLSPSATSGITGSGSATYIPLFTGSTSIGDSALIQVAGTGDLFIGSLAVPYDVIGYGNYYGTKYIINGGSNNQILVADGTTITAGTNITISGGQISASGGGGITGTGSAGQVSYWSGASSITGTNNFFWDSVNNHLGINTNTPAHALDIHSVQSTALSLNSTTLGNNNRIAFQNSGIANWRIGNFYNLGSNDFAIEDASLTIRRLTIKSSSGQTFVGDETTSSGLFVVNSSSADAHLVVLGATAPSVRVRNAGVGASLQFGLGLATFSNNFIQGTTGGEMCIFNDSLSSNPILFGINNFGLVNEAARISNSKNFLINTSIDSGEKLQVNGSVNVADYLRLTKSSTVDIQAYTGTTYSNLNYDAATHNWQTSGGIAKMILKTTGVLNLSSVPTSSAGLVSGDIYSSAGVLMIV